MLKKYLENINEAKDTDALASLIPVYKTDNSYEIALMKPSDPTYGGSDFQVSKGHIQEGETQLQGAIREAEEELGFIPKSTYEYKLLWNNKKYNIAYYFVFVDNKTLKQHHFETGAVEWWDIEKAATDIRDWQRVIVKILKRRLGL